MTHARKLVLLKDASVDKNGRLEGYGAVYGNVDDGGDVILNGAMADAIPRFLKEGFISWGHDWNVPVAMPKGASEDSKGLYFDAQFHSTPAAQEKRTITKERLDAGLTMGLSIGYGEVTKKRLTTHTELSKIGRLFEVGLVTVPMNGLAGVAGIKAAADDVQSATYALNLINQLLEGEAQDTADGDPDGPDEVDALMAARDALLRFVSLESAEVGTDNDLAEAAAEPSYLMGRQPYPAHIESIETALKALVTRSNAVARLRKEGRVLSTTNRSRLEGLLTALATASVDITDLLASTDPEAGKGHLLAAIERARFLGVPVPR